MRSVKLGFAFLVLSYFIACAPVQFEKAPEAPCGADGVACVTKCEGANCYNTLTVERVVGKGIVDILIINDNSGSMSFEQRKMADRFPDFLNSLSAIDFRIAMTTTDISNVYSKTPTDPALQNPVKNGGVLQDGNLIDFGGGYMYLGSDSNLSSSDMNTKFYTTIQRKETDDCEKSGFTNCPSSDERGVYAANLVLDRTANTFVRPTGHLAIMVLSDEDERGISDSRSDRYSGDAQLRAMYPLENYDRPATFMSKFRAKYPGKTVSVHPIIVKPGDSSCLTIQSSQGTNVRGVEGYTYQAFKDVAGGTVSSICAADYGQSLSNISTYIQQNIITLPFSCRPIDDAAFRISVNGQPRPGLNIQADFAKLEVKILDQLPPMTRVSMEYDCAK